MDWITLRVCNIIIFRFWVYDRIWTCVNMCHKHAPKPLGHIHHLKSEFNRYQNHLHLRLGNSFENIYYSRCLGKYISGTEYVTLSRELFWCGNGGNRTPTEWLTATCSTFELQTHYLLYISFIEKLFQLISITLEFKQVYVYCYFSSRICLAISLHLSHFDDERCP